MGTETGRAPERSQLPAGDKDPRHLTTLKQLRLLITACLFFFFFFLNSKNPPSAVNSPSRSGFSAVGRPSGGENSSERRSALSLGAGTAASTRVLAGRPGRVRRPAAVTRRPARGRLPPPAPCGAARGSGSVTEFYGFRFVKSEQCRRKEMAFPCPPVCL